MSYLSVGTVPVQSDGLNSALSPIVYGDIALSIKINTHTHIYMLLNVLNIASFRSCSIQVNDHTLEPLVSGQLLFSCICSILPIR